MKNFVVTASTDDGYSAHREIKARTKDEARNIFYASVSCPDDWTIFSIEEF